MAEAVVIHHEQLRELVAEQYTSSRLDAIEERLEAWGTLRFPEGPPGLVRAAGGPAGQVHYGRVWVRDCVYIAQGRWERGELEAVARTASALLHWFEAQRPRFEACIDGTADRSDPMQRPHVRFVAQTLAESDEWWPHDQNDALGVALWFLCRAALAGLLELDRAGAATLVRFARLFGVLRYFEDADAGAWEEGHEVRASSVGAVLAGLLSLRGLMASGRGQVFAGREGTAEQIDDLIARGRVALDQYLPAEFVARDGATGGRDVDAAQLFLIWPLGVVDEAMADRILAGVRRCLTGTYGIRRYVGDSFWMADYKRLFDASARTAAFGSDLAERDRHLRPGSEAQWCLFDSLLSVIHGRRFVATGEPAHLRAQVRHLNRALGQLTAAGDPLGEGLCPEAWYMEDSSRPDSWVANDATPLYWAAANLAVAMSSMRVSILAAGRSRP